MYWWPSISQTYWPWALAMNGGVPPTALKARAGLFTPPGMMRLACSNAAELRGKVSRFRAGSRVASTCTVPLNHRRMAIREGHDEAKYQRNRNQDHVRNDDQAQQRIQSSQVFERGHQMRHILPARIDDLLKRLCCASRPNADAQIEESGQQRVNS